MSSPSEKLFERACALIPGGVNSPVRAFRGVGGTPFFTEKAEGALLTTADGKTLIDYVCTWGPAIHGHNHPHIRNALSSALAKGTSFGTPSPAEVHMAELLLKHLPSADKVRMLNSGTEATMTAIRLARGCTGRDKIVKFAGCYHGHADSLLVKAGSGALTLGHPDSAGIPASFAAETLVLPFNDTAALNHTFARHGEHIAGVILEAYPANCGLILPDPGFLEHLRALCTEHGNILIFDEVMTGFRVSMGGVQAQEAIAPDLTALGKIIGGGLPVGALAGKATLMDQLAPLGPVYQAGTLSGNPLAMAAGIASLELLEQNQPHATLAERTQHLAEALLQTARKKGLPLQVPHTTAMFCLYFSETPVRNYEEATRTHTEHFRKIFHYALENGVYLPPSPFETCFLSTAHTREQLDQTTEILCDALRAL